MALMTFINICTQKEATFSKHVIASTVKNIEVELSNNKTEAAKCKMEYLVRGELKSSDPAPKSNVKDKKVGMNHECKLQWEINLKSMEKKKLSFSIVYKERTYK